MKIERESRVCSNSHVVRTSFLVLLTENGRCSCCTHDSEGGTFGEVFDIFLVRNVACSDQIVDT